MIRRDTNKEKRVRNFAKSCHIVQKTSFCPLPSSLQRGRGEGTEATGSLGNRYECLFFLPSTTSCLHKGRKLWMKHEDKVFKGIRPTKLEDLNYQISKLNVKQYSSDSEVLTQGYINRSMKQERNRTQSIWSFNLYQFTWKYKGGRMVFLLKWCWVDIHMKKLISTLTLSHI